MSEAIYIRRWSEDDWETFKTIRLEALRAHSDVFGASPENEGAQEDSFWKERLCDDNKGATFGLYDHDNVIGLTATYRHRDIANTAILCMSYIRKDYRKRYLSDLFYKERINWAKAQDDISRIIVAHREGNEASRRANQRWGFIFSHVEDAVFGNGETAKDYIYELKI